MENLPNYPIDHEGNPNTQEVRPLIGRDMHPRDEELVVINLDQRDQRDDVKKTTWH